jgi:arylsulfatase
VLPLDYRQLERFVPDKAGRPTLIAGNTQLLFGGVGRLSDNSVLDIKNKSFAVTADLDVPTDGAEGVINAGAAGSAGGATTPRTAGRRSTTTC